MAKPKRPRDPNQLAKLIVSLSTGEIQEQDPNAGKDPAAVALGRKGGLKGGKARAANLSPEALSEIGRKGVAARAAKRPKTPPESGSALRPARRRRRIIRIDHE